MRIINKMEVKSENWENQEKLEKVGKVKSLGLHRIEDTEKKITKWANSTQKRSFKLPSTNRDCKECSTYGAQAARERVQDGR